ncbi:Carbohydrate esterase [subsurface metagenome]
MMAVWAYGLMSGMDYLETQDEINPNQVAVMGCSVSGKVALWAAAQDQRIGMVLSNTTGHGGDAIWRREFGESYENMCEWLPRWLSRSAQNYKGRVHEMPVDQHMLLACIAPRPVFISNGEYDYWADPKGAWVSAYHAMPAYQLYGQEVAFESEVQPEVNEVIMKSAIGYNLRTGFHGTDQRDWENYMKFMEYHFMKIEPRSAHEIYYPDNKLIDHYPNKSDVSHIVK